MKSPEAASTFLRDLIQQIYSRPEMYCRTVGEFDTLVHFLHLVSAVIADEENRFHAVMIQELEKRSDSPAIGLITDAERIQMIPEGGEDAFTRLLGYWKAVDAQLSPSHPSHP